MGRSPSILKALGRIDYETPHELMKLARYIPIWLILAASSLSSAAETWLGLYLDGKKIGYSSSIDVPDRVNGKACVRTDSKTVISANLMGTSMTMDMASSSYIVGGKPQRMVFSITSAGRTQKMDAWFGSTDITASVDNQGQKSKKTLAIPKDGKVVDDAVNALIASKSSKSQVVYVLDPLTVSLVKNTVSKMGMETIKVAGKKVQALRVDVAEIRATTKVYLDSKSNLVVAYGPIGIEMRPMSKAQALAKSNTADAPDLADASCIKPDKPITFPSTIKELTIRISGKDLSKVPSGDHQTVKADSGSWLIAVHPAQMRPGVPIAAAASQKPEWVRPSMNMPSDSQEFVEKAKAIVGDSTTVDQAARKIHDFVHETMTPNAGIGVIRDATEVLKTKEGVCRDYAILTCTLFRAAGIPARLASGLVYQDGFFYYHAWIEAWNDGKWIGVDSTRAQQAVTAAHVKLAEGNVDEAFVFTFLEKAKISVLRITR